jgi:hypothetical protein
MVEPPETGPNQKIIDSSSSASDRRNSSVCACKISAGIPTASAGCGCRPDGADALLATCHNLDRSFCNLSRSGPIHLQSVTIWTDPFAICHDLDRSICNLSQSGPIHLQSITIWTDPFAIWTDPFAKQHMNQYKSINLFKTI